MTRLFKTSTNFVVNSLWDNFSFFFFFYCLQPKEANSSLCAPRNTTRQRFRVRKPVFSVFNTSLQLKLSVNIKIVLVLKPYQTWNWHNLVLLSTTAWSLFALGCRTFLPLHSHKLIDPLSSADGSGTNIVMLVAVSLLWASFHAAFFYTLMWFSFPFGTLFRFHLLRIRHGRFNHQQSIIDTHVG